MSSLALNSGFVVPWSQLAAGLFRSRLAIVAVTALLLCGCASTGSDELANDDADGEESYWGELAEEEDDGDPLETLNRFVFAFNETLDIFILRPAAETYRFLIPEVMRDSVHNFLENLRSPVILANKVFQGDEPGVNNTVARFAINSTLGVLGLFDVATGMGYPYQDEDFGLTLGSYDVGSGPYLVLPLFGPSSARDGIGRGVDVLLDPLTYILTRKESLARLAVTGVDKRSRYIEQIDDLKRDSVDFYTRIRSFYQQNRQKEVEERIERRMENAAMENAAMENSATENPAIENSAALPDSRLQSLAAREVQ